MKWFVVRDKKYIQDNNGCWLWQDTIASTGYAMLGYQGKTIGAHRLSYLLHVGPIPDGYVIDHLCHVRHCWNPEHLRAVSKSDNSANRKGATKNSTTGLRNIQWDSRRERYRVSVTSKGVAYGGGDFQNLESAKAAAKELRLSLGFVG